MATPMRSGGLHHPTLLARHFLQYRREGQKGDNNVAGKEKIYYFCFMNKERVLLIKHSDELPSMVCNNFFHSTQLFRLLELTPGMAPYMVVVQDVKGEVLAHMLLIVLTRRTLLPPFIFRHGHVYGEGEYAGTGENREALFHTMLGCATRLFRSCRCLYCEYSKMSSKMFGYKAFRRHGFIPIPWIEIHNSVHSTPPIQRLSHKLQQRIMTLAARGVHTRPCLDEQDTQRYVRLLKRQFRFKTRRVLPDKVLFDKLQASHHGINLLTLYKNKVIGGCTLLFSQGNAYLWFSVARRKTYALARPALMTIWGALQYAQQEGYAHLSFLDVGLPYEHSRYREFILSFGGKPTAKYRWFRFPFTGVNRLLTWIYNS